MERMFTRDCALAFVWKCCNAICEGKQSLQTRNQNTRRNVTSLAHDACHLNSNHERKTVGPHYIGPHGSTADSIENANGHTDTGHPCYRSILNHTHVLRSNCAVT